MRKNQHLTRFRVALATAAITVGLIGASLPAAAHVTAATQPARVARDHVQMYFDSKYRLPDDLIYTPGVPPGYCDLPSAGCESFLAN